jgi:arsenate reductase-like glutaredoxin family protein
MRNLTLIFYGIALAGSIASAVMFFIIGNSKQVLHNQLVERKADVVSLQNKLADDRAKADKLTSRIHQLDAELGAAKTSLDEAKFTTDELRAALELAETERTQSLAQSEQAWAELRLAQTELIKTKDLMAKSISPQQAMRYRQIIADLEVKLGKTEENLESAKKSSLPTFVSSRAYHAQLVRVGPGNSFVVINYGKSHGASANQRFEVKRGLDVLARVEISDITENYSVAQVLPETLSGNLRKGDAAIITP